jgi:hypothetical protein
MLLAFSIAFLWMIHINAMRFTIKSTPFWPQLGRMGTYGSLLIFVLLSLHARAAVHENRVLTEVFLNFFSGLIGIGIPFALYIYATKSLKRLPLSIPRLFGAFSFGTAFCYLLTAVDKLAAVHGSLHSLGLLLQKYCEMILVAGILPNERLEMPPSWIVLRGLLALGGIALFAYVSRLRSSRRDKEAEASIFFLLIAGAFGFAAFSRLKIDLPLFPLTASYYPVPALHFT